MWELQGLSILNIIIILIRRTGYLPIPLFTQARDKLNYNGVHELYHGCLIMDKEVVFYNLFFLVQTVIIMDQKIFSELGNHYSCLGKTGEELRSNWDIFIGINKQKKSAPNAGRKL